MAKNKDDVPGVSGGRQRLMDAALELAATTRSLASLGLREVARHAGLNPNTFYRHFRDFDELGVAMLAELGVNLRRGLRERRMQAAGDGLRVVDFSRPVEGFHEAQAIARESVALVLEFVTHHRAAFTVGVREMHGSSPAIRNAMRELLDGIALDMTEDLMGVLRFPGVSEDEMLELAQVIVRQMVFFSMDYLEDEARQPQILRQAERFILLLFWGAIAAKSPALLRDEQLRFPEI